jgi:hypothetical protein
MLLAARMLGILSDVHGTPESVNGMETCSHLCLTERHQHCDSAVPDSRCTICSDLAEAPPGYGVVPDLVHFSLTFKPFT